MNSPSLAYQKGDLVTIKQSSMVCTLAGGTRRFITINKPTNGIFLSYSANSEEDRHMFEYLKQSTPITRACKVAIGNDICFVDARSFFFHIKDRR